MSRYVGYGSSSACRFLDTTYEAHTANQGLWFEHRDISGMRKTLTLNVVLVACFNIARLLKCTYCFMSQLPSNFEASVDLLTVVVNNSGCSVIFAYR